MSRIVIAHGYGMGSGEHWYGSVAEELSGEGHEVRVPDFPEPFAPDAGAWLKGLRAETEGCRRVRPCWWGTAWAG